MLEVKNLNFAYEEGSEKLKSVSLRIQPGEIVALVGPNGAGKTTLFKILAGLMHPDASIYYDGTEIQGNTPLQRRKKVLYVPPYLFSEFGITVREVVELAGTADCLRECHAEDLADRSLNSLSGGETQRVLLARAFATGSRIILLDETLSLMDLNHQVLFGKILRQKCIRDGTSFFWISHDVNLAAAWSDRCYFIHEGDVFGGGTIENEFTEQNFKRLYPQTKIEMIRSETDHKPRLFFG